MANLFTGATESRGGGQIDTNALTTSNTSITQNTETSPDTTVTAETLTENSSTGRHYFYTSKTGDGSSTYYFSVFVKADGRDWVHLGIYPKSGDYVGKYFDLTNGVTGNDGTQAPDDSGIVDYGNGWYRCWLSTVPTSTSLIFTVDTGVTNSWSYTGDSRDSLSYWGLWADTVNYTDWTLGPLFKAAGAMASGINSPVTPINPALPAGWAEGDFALLWVGSALGGTTTINTVTDWTDITGNIQHTGSSVNNSRLFYRVLQAGDTSPDVSASQGSSGACVAAISTFGNVGSVGNYASTATYSGTTPTAPTATSVADNALSVRFYYSNEDSAWASPSEGALGFGGASYDYSTIAGMAMSYLVEPTAGAVGTATMTANDTAFCTALTVILEPAAATATIPIYTNHHLRQMGS